jgi:hypothetical protein
MYRRSSVAERIAGILGAAGMNVNEFERLLRAEPPRVDPSTQTPVVEVAPRLEVGA